MPTQRMPLRDVAACVAGTDIPYIMNSLFGRILTDEERQELRARAIRHLTRGRYKWLKQVKTDGMTPDSEELRAWVRQQSARYGYMLDIQPIESPSSRTPAKQSRISMRPNGARPYGA